MINDYINLNRHSRGKRNCFKFFTIYCKHFCEIFYKVGLVSYNININWQNTTIQTNKISKFEFNRLRLATKNGSGATLIISVNLIGNDETSFPWKLLLPDGQICKSFAYDYSLNIKLSKTKNPKHFSQVDSSVTFFGHY